MTKQEAEIIAQQLLESQWKGRAVVRIESDRTIEKEYGWIFFSRPLESKHPLLGNLPILVTKAGEIVRLPVSIGIDESIRRYEAGLPFFPKHKNRDEK